MEANSPGFLANVGFSPFLFQVLHIVGGEGRVTYLDFPNGHLLKTFGGFALREPGKDML